MGIIFLIGIFWIFGSVIFAELLPAVIETIYYLIVFLWLCIRQAIKLLWSVLTWAIRTLARGMSWAFSQAGLFLAILIDEWRRGPEEDAGEAFFEEEDEEKRQRSAFDEALAVLGMSEPFGLKDLQRVYRQSMKAAHTDLGGSTAAAQELNAARDLIMKTKGWK